MELLWNNRSPNHTVYRPSVWEVIGTNGTTRVISAHEIQAIAARRLDHGMKEAFNDSQARPGALYLFLGSIPRRFKQCRSAFQERSMNKSASGSSATITATGTALGRPNGVAKPTRQNLLR